MNNPSVTRLLTILAKSSEVVRDYTSNQGKRSGTYRGYCVTVDDPLDYGRIQVELNDGSRSGWLIKATADNPKVGDEVLLTYTADTDAGFYIGTIRPTPDAVVVPLDGETEATSESDWTHPRIASDIYDADTEDI